MSSKSVLSFDSMDGHINSYLSVSFIDWNRKQRIPKRTQFSCLLNIFCNSKYRSVKLLMFSVVLWENYYLILDFVDDKFAWYNIQDSYTCHYYIYNSYLRICDHQMESRRTFLPGCNPVIIRRYRSRHYHHHHHHHHHHYHQVVWLTSGS
jgi:hypothetical protein